MPTETDLLGPAVQEWQQLLAKMPAFNDELLRLGEALLKCWENRGKLLTAGNGGSAADAAHLAEELVVRYARNRRALAAVALCEPGNLTCAGNDFGYESVFSRQVEALGNPGDFLAIFTTSGESQNLLRAIDAAKSKGMKTIAFLGKTGGQAKGRCDFEFHIPSMSSARVQEGHLMLYHALCEWIDTRVD